MHDTFTIAQIFYRARQQWDSHAKVFVKALSKCQHLLTQYEIDAIMDIELGVLSGYVYTYSEARLLLNIFDRFNHRSITLACMLADDPDIKAIIRDHHNDGIIIKELESLQIDSFNKHEKSTQYYELVIYWDSVSQISKDLDEYLLKTYDEYLKLKFSLA